MNKKKFIISLISVGAAIVIAGAIIGGVLGARQKSLEDLYQKGVTYLVKSEYENATKIFADKRLANYKDSNKKYNYSFNLQRYEQKVYDYENLIDYGLKVKGCKANIDFDVDGGDPIERKSFNHQVEGKYINEIAHKTHYDFVSWKLDYAGYEKSTDSIRYLLRSNYKEHQYLIEYHLDGGSIPSTAPTHFYYDHGDVAVPDAVRGGYVFNGYASNLYDDIRKDLVIPNYTDKDVILTADYTPLTYHIKYDATPATITQEDDFVYGSDVSERLPKPSIPYHNFDGWYDGNKKVDPYSFNVDHDATLVARYVPIEFTIQYVLNGGSTDSDAPTHYNVLSRDVVIPFARKANSVFIGWTYNAYYAPVAKTIVNGKTNFNRDVTFTANYVDATIVDNVLIDISDRSIAEMVIPNEVTDIDPELISKLHNLKHIYVDNDNLVFSMEDEFLIKNKTTLFACPKGYVAENDEITVPNKVTTIGKYAFAGSNITRISGSGLVSKIDDYAFFSCSHLDKVLLNNVNYVGDGALAGTSITSSFIDDNLNSLAYIGQFAFSETKITTLNISNKVTTICDKAFYDIDTLTAVVFKPHRFCSIGEDLFEYSDNIVSLEIDSYYFYSALSTYLSDKAIKSITVTGSTDIRINAYRDHNALEHLDLSNSSISSIGASAFRNDPNLVDVKLPTTLTTIGDCAFIDSTHLEEVNFEELTNLMSIKQNAFAGSGLVEIDLSNSPNLEIEDDAFRDCYSLEEVTILDTQLEAFQDVFARCSSLVRINYYISETDRIVKIPDFMFANLHTVKLINIKYLGEGQKEIKFGNGSFKNDGTLIDVMLDNCYVTSVSSYCFENCSSFRNTFNKFDDLQRIENGAFYGCSQLHGMSLNGTTYIGDYAFAGCYSMLDTSTLVIPNTVAHIGESAFAGIIGNIRLEFTRDQVAALTEDSDCPWWKFDQDFNGVIHYAGE